MRAGLVLIVLGAAALGLSFWNSSRASVARADEGTEFTPRPPVLAVLDLKAIFDAYPKRAELEELIRSELAESLKNLEELEKGIRQMQKEIQLVKAGSSEHQRLKKAILLKESEFKFYQEEFQNELDGRRSQAHEQLVSEIQQVVKEYSKENGIDLVLQQKIPMPGGMAPYDLVFHAESRYDITRDILSALNQK